MTLVVTERHGSVAIFSKLSDGTLRQRGLLDSDGLEASHLELAQLAEGLSTTLGWNGVDVSNSQPVTKRGRKAVGATKRRELPAASEAPPESPKRRKYESTVPPGYRSLPRGIASNSLRPPMIEEIVDDVRANPGATSSAISKRTKIHDRTIDGLLRRSEVHARLRYEQASKTDPRRYFVRDEPTTLLDANV
jgi:hypothetical protein